MSSCTRIVLLCPPVVKLFSHNRDKCFTCYLRHYLKHSRFSQLYVHYISLTSIRLLSLRQLFEQFFLCINVLRNFKEKLVIVFWHLRRNDASFKNLTDTHSDLQEKFIKHVSSDWSCSAVFCAKRLSVTYSIIFARGAFDIMEKWKLT